jgi:hypothetical protein
MYANKQPTKEMVRQWLRTELAQRRPPPGPEAIRQMLGWDLERRGGMLKR